MQPPTLTQLVLSCDGHRRTQRTAERAPSKSPIIVPTTILTACSTVVHSSQVRNDFNHFQFNQLLTKWLKPCSRSPPYSTNAATGGRCLQLTCLLFCLEVRGGDAVQFIEASKNYRAEDRTLQSILNCIYRPIFAEAYPSISCILGIKTRDKS